MTRSFRHAVLLSLSFVIGAAVAFPKATASTPDDSSDASELPVTAIEVRDASDLHAALAGTELERNLSIAESALARGDLSQFDSEIHSVIATSTGITVLVDAERHTERLGAEIARAFPPDVGIETWPADEPELASPVHAGDGIESNDPLDGRYCSEGLTGYVPNGPNFKWYFVTAGHCNFAAFFDCGVQPLNESLGHHPQAHSQGGSRHGAWNWSNLPVLFPHDSTGPSDQAAVYIAQTASVSSPPTSASRYVRSATGSGGIRQIASVGDAATFLATTGVTLESYGHKAGGDSSTFTGIAVSWVFEGCLTLTYPIVTNTGTGDCNETGNSGGPIYGIYYPGTANAPVSVLGTLSGAQGTPFGNVCYWSQPGFALDEWDMTAYEF